MALDFSKIIVSLPIFGGFVLIAIDYFFGFEVNEQHIQLIEFMIGSTVIGGVGNASMKRFVAYKEKIKVG